MPGRRSVVRLLLLTVALACGSARAQQGDLRLMADKYKADQEQLRDYAWTRRTEVSVAGDVREVTLSRLRYDPDGILQETPLAETEPKNTGGPIRKRRIRKTRQEAAALSAELWELIRTYTEFTSGQMRSVFERASVFSGAGEEQGTVRVQVRGVVREGDSLYIWADEGSRRLRKFEILTSIGGQPVKVVTEFGRLENGPSYPAHVTIDTEMKGKPMVIRMENFDFIRQGN